MDVLPFINIGGHVPPVSLGSTPLYKAVPSADVKDKIQMQPCSSLYYGLVACSLDKTHAVGIS